MKEILPVPNQIYRIDMINECLFTVIFVKVIMNYTEDRYEINYEPVKYNLTDLMKQHNKVELFSKISDYFYFRTDEYNKYIFEKLREKYIQYFI
jgi:hypothetical protein